jgi:hypothetical protein
MVAVLALSALPAAHLHRSLSGKTLIHSHLETHESEHHGALDHGEHQTARTVAAVFTTEPTTNWLTVPAVVTAVFLLTAPETLSAIYVGANDAPAIHGPPPRASLLRGPPA